MPDCPTPTKRAFRSQCEAKRWERKYRGRRRKCQGDLDRLFPYECAAGDHWHLTHQQPRPAHETNGARPMAASLFQPPTHTPVQSAPAPEGKPRPALAPPPIMPWNGFDTTQENERTIAVEVIAEILQDDQWHLKTDVISEVLDEADLSATAVSKLLASLKSHGDIRQNDDHIRLTTRWQGWTADGPYGPKGDAVTDDTAAIQRILGGVR